MKTLPTFTLLAFAVLNLLGGLSVVRAADTDPLQGVWTVVGLEANGTVVDAEQVKAIPFKVVINGDKISYQKDGVPVKEATIKLNSTTSPKEINTTDDKGTVELGIYDVDGDQFTLCSATRGGIARPTEFSTKPNSGHMVFKFKREKK